MNLAATLSMYAGGPGSGCQGPNCGRPRTVTFYHGTTGQALRGILKNGLIPGSSLGVRRSKLDPLGYGRAKRGFVYLTKSQGVARWYARYHKRQEGSGAHGVVLEVNLPIDTARRYVEDDPDDLRVSARRLKGTIPAEYLRVKERV